MKKFIILFLLSTFSLVVTAQNKTVKISELQIGVLSCKYSMRIDLEKKDTIRYIYLGFQNAKYSSITDIKSVMFDVSKDSTDVYDFKKDLKMALSEIGNKTSISWDKKNYSVALYDFNNKLYLREASKDGSGYTLLTKGQVEKLIDWIDIIGFKNS